MVVGVCVCLFACCFFFNYCFLKAFSTAVCTQEAAAEDFPWVRAGGAGGAETLLPRAAASHQPEGSQPAPCQQNEIRVMKDILEIDNNGEMMF